MPSLAAIVAKEQGVDPGAIMLLRHASDTIRQLRELGGTVEDYTVVQPLDSKYDYRHSRKPPVEVVVVIVDDRVEALYRIDGVERLGTNFELETPAMRILNQSRGRPERKARRYAMTPLRSAVLGLPVRGWKDRQRTPVQRSDGTFFHAIEVDGDAPLPALGEIEAALAAGVVRSLGSTRAQRLARLRDAPRLPPRVEVRTTVFLRNADVIAEVLERAAGKCELCGAPAPFARHGDGTPYLEVHHRVRLADGGEDTVDNACAACPNCHRRAHFG